MVSFSVREAPELQQFSRALAVATMILVRG